VVLTRYPQDPLILALLVAISNLRVLAVLTGEAGRWSGATKTRMTYLISPGGHKLVQRIRITSSTEVLSLPGFSE
jgi:hypothetical protein